MARAVSQQEERSLRGAARSGGRRGSGSDFPAAWIWDWDLGLGFAAGESSECFGSCLQGWEGDGWLGCILNCLVFFLPKVGVVKTALGGRGRVGMGSVQEGRELDGFDVPAASQSCQ